MYAIVAVVVIIVVVAAVAGAYVLMNPGGGGGGGGGGGDTFTAANATSLQYQADITSQGATVKYDFAGRNLGTANQTFRIDILGGETGNYSYILNAGDQTAWTAVNGVWTDISSEFLTQWDSWGAQWTANVNALGTWTTGSPDVTYNGSNGESIVISNIVVNPTLPDSLFLPNA